MLETLLEWDRNIFIWFHNLRHPLLDYFLGWPTYLGASKILFVVILILMFLWDRKNLGRRYSFFFLVMLTTDIVTHLLKYWIHRPRPFVALKELTPISVLFNEPVSYSFPSGHSSIIFCAAVLINELYHQRFRFLYLVAFWVCLTRMYVGVHYPSDLISGAVLGAGIAWGACRITEKFFPRIFRKIEEK